MASSVEKGGTTTHFAKAPGLCEIRKMEVLDVMGRPRKTPGTVVSIHQHPMAFTCLRERMNLLLFFVFV